MRACPPVKTTHLVGVITCRAELHRALRLRRPPDFFELRLDALLPLLDEVEEKLEALPAPLIITARPPHEGGHHPLTVPRRRELHLRFLPHATCVDLELRSLNSLRRVFERAGELGVQRILSFHDFARTPSLPRLHRLAAAARAAGAEIFKVATQVSSETELQRLLDFLITSRKQHLPVSVMGMGKFGRASRVLLVQHGSALNYAHLGSTAVPGQLSLPELRRASSSPISMPNPRV